MTRATYFALWAAWGLGMLTAFSFGLVGIWLESDKAATTAAMIGFPTLFGLVGLIPMAVVDGTPPRGLPRSARKALRSEQDRIALEAAIAKAEREAGIR